MRELAFAYGKGSVKVHVREELVGPDCILAARAPEPADSRVLLREALVGQRWDLTDPVVVVVPDATRPIDCGEALEALEPILRGRDVEVIVGAGLHPAAPPTRSPWPCSVHDARAGDLVAVADGVWLHPRVAEAGAVVVVSAILPHYLAGFSGGWKAIVPGVAGESTILDVHARAEDGPAAFRAAIAARARHLAAPVFALNLLVSSRGPFDATAGGIEDAHRQAVERYHRACAQPRPEPADVVVADAGGHPVDATLLQAHKAYEAAAALVQPGGTIVLIAACGAGYGHPEFRRRLADPAGPYHPYARTASAWWRKARAHETLLVTELDTAGLGAERVSLEEAIARIPAGARVLWAHSAQDLLFS